MIHLTEIVMTTINMATKQVANKLRYCIFPSYKYPTKVVFAFDVPNLFEVISVEWVPVGQVFLKNKKSKCRYAVTVKLDGLAVYTCYSTRRPCTSNSVWLYNQMVSELKSKFYE